MKNKLNKPKGPNPFPKPVALPREKHPEPMTMMHHRLKEIMSDAMAEMLKSEGKPIYNKPEVTAGLASKAAGAMADWDNSDPFAYGRTYLHVKQGYVDPRDIVKDMGKRTLDRRIAKAREVEDAKSH